VTVLAGILALALFGQAQPTTYYWRDAAGQTHITNTPPPPDAEVLQAPPPPAVEPGKTSRPEVVRQSTGLDGQHQVQLSPVQQQAWGVMEERLARARAEGDRQTLEAVADSLVSDCLWGHGLWAMPAAPLVTVALLGLLGWWLALGLRTSLHAPLVAGSLLLGLVLGHVLLNALLYRSQAQRLRQNLKLLEQHLGAGKALRPEQRRLLELHQLALGKAADPRQPPWRFPLEVKTMRAILKQVMVEP
jgi:Domain of unknown function (DUF4124)